MKKLAIGMCVLGITLLIPLGISWTREPMPTVGNPLPPNFQPHPHGALASSTALYPTFVSPLGRYRVGVDAAKVVRLVIPMNDDAQSSAVAVPKMFYWISGAALVWNLIGVAAYVGQMTMSPETLEALPEAERALYENVPAWVTSAFAIAVNAGALGCLLLLLRKAVALPVLILSLAAVLVQMFHAFFMTNSIEVLGAGAAIGPTFVIVIGIYLVWFANDAKQKGWIG